MAVFDPPTDVEGESSDVPFFEVELVDVLGVEVEVSSAAPATSGHEVDGAGFAEFDLEGGGDDGSECDADSEFPVEGAIGGA